MRTFIALELPLRVQQTLESEQQRLLARLQKEGLHRLLRLSRPHNMHLTLRFLGETTAAQAEAIAQQLAVIAEKSVPFELALTHVGCFPNVKKPSVLWMGIDGEMEQLRQLQEAIENRARSLGFVADKYGFSPHITLARVHGGTSAQQKQQVGTLLQTEIAVQAEEKERAVFLATHVVHFRSDLQFDAPIYTPLTTVRLMNPD